MRVGTLKRELRALGGKCRGCTEKQEYVRAMLVAQGGGEAGEGGGQAAGEEAGNTHAEL